MSTIILPDFPFKLMPIVYFMEFTLIKKEKTIVDTVDYFHTFTIKNHAVLYIHKVKKFPIY